MKPTAIQVADDLFHAYQSAEVVNEQDDQAVLIPDKAVFDYETVINLLKKWEYIQPDWEGWAKQISASNKIPDRTQYQISRKIQCAMDQKGINAKDLATLTHKAESEITRWISGQNMTIKTLVIIQDALKINLLDLS